MRLRVSYVACPDLPDACSAGEHFLARCNSAIARRARKGGNMRRAPQEVWQIARAQITYSNANADSDAVIAGLITALSAGQTPESLSSLQTKLSSGVSDLVEFCGTVSNLLPKTDRQKGIATDIAKMVPVETLLNKLSDAISAVYGNIRNDDALTRKTIQTQLQDGRRSPRSRPRNSEQLGFTGSLLGGSSLQISTMFVDCSRNREPCTYLLCSLCTTFIYDYAIPLTSGSPRCREFLCAPKTGHFEKGQLPPTECVWSTSGNK